MNRCYELERSYPIHNQYLGFKIGMCSKVKPTKFTRTGHKAKPEYIEDGAVPMHYKRMRTSAS